MGKAEETKQLIIARAAALFNQQGYSGTSISDLMQATGLQKGGIYNHFGGKDALALAAFDYAYGLMRGLFGEALREAKGDPLGQLVGMIDVFARNADRPPVAGGCPLLNTAIESDDTHPALRAKAQGGLDEWRGTIARIVARGQARGVMRPEVDGDMLATLIIATMEGALMMSRVYGDPVHVQRAAAHLRWYIQEQVVSGGVAGAPGET